MYFGQILYNVEDYAGAGGIVTSDTSRVPHTQDYYDIMDENEVKNPKVDIFSTTFLEDVGISNISKLGIQAPPGTKFWINTTEKKDEGVVSSESISTHIMVGRTGVYELEVPNYNIDTLYFERPTVYTLDVDLSNDLVNKGRAEMQKAKDEFEMNYQTIVGEGQTAVTTNTNNDFWIEYQRIHDKYVTAYNAGRAFYIQGMAGVYKDNGQRDLYNIIIDFTYESSGEVLN